MYRIVKLMSILFCCLLCAACVSDVSVRSEFEKSVKQYNSKLRWREIESAGLLFMETDQLDAFMASAAALRKRDITITDYRVLAEHVLTVKETGDATGSAVVEFDYYIMPSNRVKTLTYKQDWVYHEIGKRDYFKQMAWKLKSGLPAFE
ncbi:MAG: hypothetical protein HXX11_07500 [Desulfuromonadales bacterium]|nr:hypothetical protein [Desulfuromonadales bacterium]